MKAIGAIMYIIIIAAISLWLMSQGMEIIGNIPLRGGY